jgi:hypothetical protein
MKVISKKLGAPECRFASDELLTEVLNVVKGSVTPFAAINDCSRKTTKPVSNLTTTTPADCLQACAALATCASWTWTGPSGLCTLAGDVPASVHTEGAYCGVAGRWSSDVNSVNFIMHPAAGQGGPANGDIALRPVLDSGSVPSGVSSAAAGATGLSSGAGSAASVASSGASTEAKQRRDVHAQTKKQTSKQTNTEWSCPSPASSTGRLRGTLRVLCRV